MKAEEIEIKLTAENCQTYFDLFMALREHQIERFMSRLNQALGEGTLDFSVESLDRAWFYVRDHLQCIKTTDGYANPDALPIWLRTNIHTLGNADEVIFSDKSLNLIDQLIFYYGEVILKTIPNTRWVLDREEIPHVDNFRPFIANYDLGEERSEGYLACICTPVCSLVWDATSGKVPPIRIGHTLITKYNRDYDFYQAFLALPDEQKYPPPPPPIEVEGRKKKSDWMGDDGSVLAKTQGYFEVSITDMAEIELGDQFLIKNDQGDIVGGIDKHFEKIDGVEMVYWYDRRGMQIATTLNKKKLEAGLNACYEALKKSNK